MTAQHGKPEISEEGDEVMRIRTQVKAGAPGMQHNETVQVRTGLQGGRMRRRLVTTSAKEDRLALLVVRAGLRAGRGRIRSRK
jgi:hypothetical protein